MKYSELKKIKFFCDDLHYDPDWREVLESALSGDDSFEVDNVRFIAEDSIDAIQCDELESDLYTLGCFNAWFLADVTGLDSEVIEAMKSAEAFEALGNLVISMGKLSDLQQAYASADGYGHHFNRYDGGEEEIMINGRLFLVFDNH